MAKERGKKEVVENGNANKKKKRDGDGDGVSGR
jgi:hypothetical protein